MVDRSSHRRLPLKRQCELLGLARSSAYYVARGPDPETLALIRRIDEIYTECPFYGSRQMARALRREDQQVSRKRVQRLMRLMGLQALAPKPNLSKPTPGHKVYPYLMRALKVDRPNQAWCADITYVRLKEGFVYLFAIMDWHSRKVLAWELSNSLDAAFCVSALERAVEAHGPPEVINTDQGCQFTGKAWIQALGRHKVKISMDGRGRALDNAFVERLWRSVKYEEVYRREYGGVRDVRRHLAAYFRFYNGRRPHSSLGGRTPDEIHHAPTLSHAA